MDWLWHNVTAEFHDDEEPEDRAPRTVDCHCGRKVELWNGWSNPCVCGQEYNGFGQALAPRSQWGEETGEDFSDDDYNREMMWGTTEDPSVRGPMPGPAPRRRDLDDWGNPE